MKVQVSVNNVKIIEPSILNENEYNIHECEFEFTEEYNGLTKKAVFTNEANETYVETIVDDKCSIPSEVLKDKENVKLGVYAYDVDNEELLLRYSPRPTEFYVHEGSYKEGQNSTPPTPSEVEQLQAQITQNANDIDDLENDVGFVQEKIADIEIEQITQNDNIQTNANNISTINGQIITINQDIDNLESTKADKSEIPTKTSDLINDSDFVSDSEYVHTDNNFTDEDKAQINQNATDISTLQSTKADKTEIPTKTSDLTNDSGFINKNVNDLINYTLKTNTGSLIDLEINGTTYVITLSLKDVDGNVISTDTIDLPLESVVVGGSYDAVNKKIVLTLENGNTVDIPVGDLIAGLQTEITSSNKLASDLVDDSNSGNKFVTTSEKQTWNGKYDKPVGGIPSTDLSSGVQASLDKADTAIQQSDLADYVKNTDYATISKGGVFKTNTAFATGVSNGFLFADTRTYQQYGSSSGNLFISKGTLENVIAGKELINQTQLEESQATQDTEIETLQNQVEDLEQDVEDLRGACLSVEGTGTDIVLHNTAQARLLKNELSGRTEQESLSGKNLFDKDSPNIIQNQYLLPAGNTGNNQNFGISDYISVLENTQYSLQPYRGLGSAICFYDENKTFLSGIQLSQANPNFTTPTSCKYLRVSFQKDDKDIEQLEQGTTATSYEPYCGGIPSPNPDFTQQIKNVTGNANVKIQNKNMFDKDNATTVVGYFSGDGSINYGGSSTITTSYSEIKPNTNMIVSGCPIEAICFYDKNKNFIERSFISANVPFNKNAYFIRLQAPTNTFDINKLQLELGTTATSYVPHQEQNLPFTFAEGQRGMQGTTLEDDGIHNKRKHYVYTGNENFYLSGYTDTLSAVFRSEFTDIKIGGTQGKCNIGYVGIIDNIYTNINGFFYNNVGQQGFLKIQKSSIPNWDDSLTNEQKVALFKAFLAQRYANNNPVEVEYELETEEIIPYNSTQQAQYNAIKQARSNDDQTNFSSTSTELGFNMDVESLANANKVIDSLDTRLSALESEV